MLFTESTGSAVCTGSCLACPVPMGETGFCRLPPAVLEQLDSTGMPFGFPAGVTIFWKGQQPRGVYLVRSGQVKLGDVCALGRTMALQICGPGYVLGLAEAMGNRPYSLTAEALGPVQTKFITLANFRGLLQTDPAVNKRITEQLSDDLTQAYRSALRASACTNAQTKLASLLLEWADQGKKLPEGGVRLHVPLTHKQIGEFVGLGRETVTRTLREFRDKELVRTKGVSLDILDVSSLEVLLSSPELHKDRRPPKKASSGGATL